MADAAHPPIWRGFTCGAFDIKQRAPSVEIFSGEAVIGVRHGDQLLCSVLRGLRQRFGHRSPKPVKRARVHGQYQIVEVPEHIIDRANRTARILCQITGAQVF